MKTFLPHYPLPATRFVTTGLFGALLLTVAALIIVLSASDLSAQSGSLNVTSVTTQSNDRKTTVSINGDGPLDRTQTWRDSEGFHVILPNAAASEGVRSQKGVKIRRVGGSVEIIVQTRPGTAVNVEENGNNLILSVDGKLDNRPTPDPHETASQGSYSSYQRDTSSLPYQPSFTPRNSESTGLPTVGRDGFVENPLNEQTSSEPGTETPVIDDKQSLVEQEEGLLASVFSGTSVLIVVSLGLFGMLVSRKLQSRAARPNHWEPVSESGKEPVSEGSANAREQKQSTALVRSGGKEQREHAVRLPVSTPASLFGAYRIDQEVSKLISGQAHRMDVLCSRAPDDRRAILTSLLKAVSSSGFEEPEQNRARGALEEYGFVARECAALLMSTDPFERTSAARSLGEIKSAAALPFLLEGLYDGESIVRNQAVISIGELRSPAAIGALLDMARRHPDVPSSLVSRALSACSVEGLDFFDADQPEQSLLSATGPLELAHEMTQLDPVENVEELPESTDDEGFVLALERCASENAEERGEGAKELSQFAVQTAVVTLSELARCDAEPNVRVLAISGLAAINHQSVFPAILIGMADEAREVRAAAARSLTRLNFDRSDAYARVMECGDAQLLADVARACINAGIVSQNINRLTSNDRRHTYETFAVFCLLAKAGRTEPIVEAIISHEDIQVRLMSVHLFANTGAEGVVDQLQQLAINDDVPEDVKTAVLEALYKHEQHQPEDEEKPETFWVSNDAEAVTTDAPEDDAAATEDMAPREVETENVFDERDF